MFAKSWSNNKPTSSACSTLKDFFCSNKIRHIKDAPGASSTSIAFVQQGSNGELVEGSCSELIKVSNNSN